MLRQKCIDKNASNKNASTKMVRQKCFDKNASTKMLRTKNASTKMLRQKCFDKDASTNMLRQKCFDIISTMPPLFFHNLASVCHFCVIMFPYLSIMFYNFPL